LKVLLFGILSEITEATEIEIADVLTVDDLKNRMYEKYPMLQNQQFFVAINHEKSINNEKIKPGDKIALLPAFAGG